jgi:Domain of unknown function (DUF4337)
MSGHGFHVHGPHDHAVEHEAQGEHGSQPAEKSGGFSLGQTVAVFTAVLATVGAIVSYLGGHSQNEALYHKNDAVLKKAEASNTWAQYQAKSTKQNLAELAEGLASTQEQKVRYTAEIKRYGDEKAVLKKVAEGQELASAASNVKSEAALNPHDKLAMAMTFIQIAISLASICVLTRRRWMLGLAGASAAVGLGYWAAAYLLHGMGH